MKYLIIFIGSILLLSSACKQTADQPNTATKKFLSQGEKDSYLKKGKSIASQTFNTLSGQLQQALQRGGVSEAVRYCNLAASPIVDSLSRVHKATIRRSSNKLRNPGNAPTLEEAQVIKDYLLDADANIEIKPFIKEYDNHALISFYAPIRTMPLCLNCHGTVGKELKIDDYGIIQNLYPNDKATGYVSGEVRGIWSISFRRTEAQ